MEAVKGKNILVVGATGGIGSRTAKLLAGSGANIFLTGRDTEKLQSIAAEMGLKEDRYFAVDISSPEEIATLRDK
ncbi:MAG: SDR family NAD(P)-dependent oxidoreductase, partial [Chitinophagaceae bacterium]|nr:SDR family NAD(P)-dependent oxidoreductase [Chitinophagaceae bacterium]